MCSLIEDKDLVLVHYHTPSTQLLPQPQPAASTMDVAAPASVAEVAMPHAPPVPMPHTHAPAHAAQAATRAGPSPLGRAAHLAHAHPAWPSLAPAASSPLAPPAAASSASPLVTALGAARSPPTLPTNLSPHAALSSHAASPHAALSPHGNLSAASTPTSLSDAQHTIQELEARIRQLELEKISSPQPAAFSPAAVTAAAAATSPAAAVTAAAASATMPTVPATAAAAAAAAPSPPTPDSTLVLLDFSPEWDEACGGAKMLLTAGTRPGCSYAARFGDVVVGAVLVQPNVLRVHVPPAPGERGGDVALRLLCLSPQGQLLHESGPARFTYRGAPFGRRGESGASRGHTPPPLMPRAASYDSFGPRSSQSVDRSPSSSPFGAQPVPLRLAAAASLSGASPLSAFGPPRVPRSPACSATSSSVGHLELGQLDLLMAGDGGGSGGGGSGGSGGGGGGGSSSDGGDCGDSGDESGGGGSGSGAAEGDSLFAMALSLTSGPESALEQHFVQLIGALGDDDVTQLRRLQRAVRHRLRHRAPVAHRAGQAERLSGSSSGGALSERGEGGVEGGDGPMGSDEAVSRVQRTFRSRRRQRIDLDSRRRAALAIERHYLKRRRGGALAGIPRSISMESRRSRDSRDSGGAGDDDGLGDVSDVGVGLVMRAQAAFRARQARKQAVRRIEQTYLEWRYHAEQANLAAQGVRDSGSAPGDADTSLQLHHYHAQCRERAARTIQAFLLKQQQQSDAAQVGAASGDLRGGDARDPSPFSEVQLQLLRRAQRAFRAHVARQAEDAQELAEQTRRDATAVAGHAELCEVLRRAAAGDALAADESSLLAQLQLAFRSNLERRRRAANTIWRAARRSTMPRVDEAHDDEGLSGPGHPAPMHE